MLKRFTLLIFVVSMLLTLAPAMAEIQYPLDTDVELTIWMPISSSVTNKISSYAENESFTYAQTATGVKLKFIHPVQRNAAGRIQPHDRLGRTAGHHRQPPCT